MVMRVNDADDGDDYDDHDDYDGDADDDDDADDHYDGVGCPSERENMFVASWVAIPDGLMGQRKMPRFKLRRLRYESWELLRWFLKSPSMPFKWPPRPFKRPLRPSLVLKLHNAL
jgi:hypothetical protein